ncbi:MAG: adenosylcobinamide amidohydrolase [Actinomycetota bacterium]
MVETPPTAMEVSAREGVLVARFASPMRCLSSAVLGGGLGEVRSWLDVQVPSDYSRTDPEAHLAGVAGGLGLPGPVVGMLTAVLVEDYVRVSRGSSTVVATVGVRDPLAAASAEPPEAPRAGTINVLAVVGAPLTDAALVGAACTVVEAKAGALAEAGVRAAGGEPATGTATDSLCVACPPGSSVPFAGPATAHGRDLALAVRGAVLRGLELYAERGEG